VGLNYRTHILEMGRELPEHPTLFAKFPEALVGPHDEIALDPQSQAVDWEAELAVVVGAPVRRATEAEAEAAIAGFAVLNDVTMRDWQYRTLQWLQGKTFEATTPFGPQLVTPDELPGGVRPALALTCAVDGETVQSANTSDLVFDPVALVGYVSRILTLGPGDVIATGPPGGVGHARTPARYLPDGAVLTTAIDGLGEQRNAARAVVAAGVGEGATPAGRVAPAWRARRCLSPVPPRACRSGCAGGGRPARCGAAPCSRPACAAPTAAARPRWGTPASRRRRRRSRPTSGRGRPPPRSRRRRGGRA